MIRPLVLIVALFLAACNGDTSDADPPVVGDTTPAVTVKPPTQYTYRVVNRFPHDTSAFTQGLLVHDGRFLESTGRPGLSSLREVEIATGRIIRRYDLPAPYFAEGLALHDGRLYQLTWQNYMGFVYDLSSFRQLDTFRYYGEGWGLTTDGAQLIMSDGTSQLRYMKPADMTLDHTIDVHLPDGRKVDSINELEWIEGELWGNVYLTDQIVRINPSTGVVLGIVDLTGILPQTERLGNEDVLNGIAYDSATKKIYVTGKLWPAVYEIEIVPKASM